MQDPRTDLLIVPRYAAGLTEAPVSGHESQRIHSHPAPAGSVPSMTGPVNAFFDDVLVMAEDPELRKARLGLLATINSIADGVLDWRAL